MDKSSNPLKITEVVLRDAHQSLLATRMKTEDMLPIAEKLDAVGFFSLEMWGGATFDTCIRFLNEDPWERSRQLKKKMPNTPFQMLLRDKTASATGITPTISSNGSSRNPPTWGLISSASSTR